MPVAAPAAPVLRVKPASDEPPPWVDAPYEDEAPSAAEPPAAMSRPAAPERSAAPMPAMTPESPAESRATNLVRTPLGDRWAATVDEMVGKGLIGALVRELAMQAQCIAAAHDGPTAVFTLRVERETLRAQAQRDKLQAALSQHLGQPVRLETEGGIAEDSPALRATAERERRQREAEQIIHNDPLVKALMAQYKTARIVPGSIKPH